MAIKLDINGTREEFDIAGDIYTVDMSDEAMQGYIEKYNTFIVKANDLEKSKINYADGETFTEEQLKHIKKSNEESLKLIKDIYDVFFGPGSFEKIYAKTGKSSHTMASILMQVMDVIKLKHSVNQSDKKNKYLNK